ncbi:predicted protein [Candida tropicalis MYA-3404]|uniref:Uncharacterized protein n=1 Tax=Candida tropicalis (strain ATCC MYA-3404 / T1) TaxID=294747 RepID=C5MBU8_CANTT|nr:predicted protein [Candida tropicalis MYA-3404]EER33115.1 predicted protein [Candida tropicalis MYA-3404]KAG4406943.1 hypothetical protein JTP64_004327 [Candida tropicalis]
MFTRNLSTISRSSRLLFSRFNSTTAKQYVRTKPKFFDLLNTPTTKSLIWTLITTSIIVDMINSRKNLETLSKSYNLKFEILEDLIAKLERNEKVDIAQELKLANSFTENKYNSRTDVEVDEQLDQFLKQVADEVEKEDQQVQQEQAPVIKEPVVIATQLNDPKPKKSFY